MKTKRARTGSAAWAALLFAGATFASAQIPPPTDAPKARTPEQSAAAFKLPAGFRMEIVASEPLLAAPSGICWDERGQMFVSELHGYNLAGQLDIEDLNKSGKLDTQVRRVQADEKFKKAAEAGTFGVIKLLRDTDGDRRMDKATIWATNLPPAYGLVPARGGIELSSRTTVEPSDASAQHHHGRQHDDEAIGFSVASGSNEKQRPRAERREIPQRHKSQQARLGQKCPAPKCGVRGGMHAQKTVAERIRPDHPGDEARTNQDNEATVTLRTAGGGALQMVGERDEDDDHSDTLQHRSLDRTFDEFLDDLCFVHRAGSGNISPIPGNAVKATVPSSGLGETTHGLTGSAFWGILCAHSQNQTTL